MKDEITIDECEARIWNDTALIAEALADSDHLHWSLKIVKSDRDPMSRNERAWNALEFAVRCRAESMADEMNSVTEDGAEHESRLMDRDNARAINGAY